MIDPGLMGKIRTDLDRWETPILWMYLDSEGLVTVGCGTMLPSSESAKAIPFFHDKTLNAATGAEIATEWTTLHSGSAVQKAANPRNKFGANHYRTSSDLRITASISSSLRDSHVAADYQELKRIYVGFDLLPEDAKLALFDMIYNLGPGRSKTRLHRASGLRGYAHMNTAISKGDWATAALSCMRHGIPSTRNNMTSALFRNCATKKSA